MDPRLKTSFGITIVIGVLMVAASAAGLFASGLYRDTLWVSSQFRGADLVRLLVVVPLLAWALVTARRGSELGTLLWLGILWLSVYDYAFYLFGAAFNELFLVYVALFSLSILALVFALPRVDPSAVARRFSERTPVRLVAIYLGLVAAFLGVLWTAQTIAFLRTGELPASLVASGHVTEVVFALDLSLVVPAFLIAAVWLWQRRPWGYVLAAMMIVKGTLYPVALLGMGVFAARAGVMGAGDLTGFWATFALASTIMAVLLFRGLDRVAARSPRRAPV